MHRIVYNGKEYGIIIVAYKEYEFPILLDWDDFKRVIKMGKQLMINNNGVVYYKSDDKIHYLHELIMAFMNFQNNKYNENKCIIHINKIGFDNRRENLMYDNCNKNINKNIKKKKRTIDIDFLDADSLPTYMFYTKESDSNGDRFTVKFGDILWYTSSSKQISSQYKFEEAKKFMRQLKEKRNDICLQYSMNGDYTIQGKKLYEAYFTITKKAGYNNIKNCNINKSTDEYLKEDLSDLNNEEINNLRHTSFEEYIDNLRI